MKVNDKIIPCQGIYFPYLRYVYRCATKDEPLFKTLKMEQHNTISSSLEISNSISSILPIDKFVAHI